MYLGALGTDGHGNEPPVSRPVARQKILTVGRASEHTLPRSVGGVHLIRHLVGLLLPAQKGLDLLDASGACRRDHLGHLDDPVALQLAVDVLIVELAQIVGKPLVPDRQKTEKRGFARSLTAHQTEHILKLAPGLKYPPDRAHHKQLQRLMVVVAHVAAEKVVQGVPYPLLPVPCQAVQTVLYGVIAVLIGDDVERFENLLLIGQPVAIFKVPEQIVHLGTQTGIKADRLDAVLERVFDFAVLAGIEGSSDLLLGLRYVCSCMIVCIDHIITSSLRCEGIPSHN